MGATTDSAAAGVETLPPGDSSSPSSGPDRLTPESSSSEDLGKEAHGLAMDPLLSSDDDDDDDSSDGDEVYELRDRGSRAVDGRPRNGFAYTAEEERVVVAKFDRRLVLFVAFLYMLSFLDRSSSSHFSFPHLADYFPLRRSWYLRPAPKRKCHLPMGCHSSSNLLLGAESLVPKETWDDLEPYQSITNILRIDIGNALTAGMDDDLGDAKDGGAGGAGHGKAYFEWALASFYIAYIAFEWMSLLWSRIPAHVYVASIVLSWGVVASLQAVATSYPVLIALRFLLGVGEAGFTGIPIYLSFFFRREELALRTAIFISGKA